MRGELASIETQIVEADARLAKEFPEYNALTNPKPLSLADTQALLASDETLISYLIGEKTSYVFAVSRDSLSWKELEIGADELNKTVSSIRLGLNFDDIQRKKASPVKLEALYELYLKILQPVDEFIRPKPKLIVVLDGALTSLPFQLLVTESPKGAVIARRPISSDGMRSQCRHRSPVLRCCVRAPVSRRLANR